MKKLAIYTTALTLAMNAFAGAAQADCLPKYASVRKTVNDESYKTLVASLVLSGVGTVFREDLRNTPGALASGLGGSMALMSVYGPLFGEEKIRQAEYVAALMEQARNPGFDRSMSATTIREDLAPLIGKSPLLKAQTDKSLLNAVKWGDLMEKFCRGGKLMTLTEIREQIEQDITKRSKMYPSEQRETTLQLMKQIDDRIEDLERRESPGTPHSLVQ